MQHFRQFVKYAMNGEIPNDLSQITHRHINQYLMYRTETLGRTHDTKFQDYVTLCHFFRFIHEEEPDIVPVNPMDKAQKVKSQVTKRNIPVPSDETIEKIINAWNGTDFYHRRNKAVLCLLADTGARASEILVKTSQFDFEAQEVAIIGKGGKARIAPYGDMTSAVLLKYQRRRKQHRYAESEAFFLGQQGPLTYTGLRNIKEATIEKAGISRKEFYKLHQFRHKFVHEWKLNGGQEGDLEEILGWTEGSRMHGVYAESLKAYRALQAYKNRKSPLDNLNKRPKK